MPPARPRRDRPGGGGPLGPGGTGGPDRPGPGDGPELDRLRARVADLESENVTLRQDLEILRTTRTKVDSARLVQSFHAALEAARQELATPPDATFDYVVSGFDVDLKAGIETDEGGKVLFRLPEQPGPAGETLSTVRFAIRTVPKMRKTT
jgi:hypothetical protein